MRHPTPPASFRPAAGLIGSIGLLGLLVLGTAPAGATLGEPLASVASAQTQLRVASAKVAQRATHRLHESTLESGTVVREFTDASGIVFAVAWQGPFKPNLQVLLGSHFNRLVAAGKQPHRDHRRLAVRDRDLVIESNGRMRAFNGLAYLPSRVPAGFNFEEAVQ
jgi:Protein of unknown function (DUF2844)